MFKIKKLENFAVIESLDDILELKDLTIFMGDNSAGKSYLAMLINSIVTMSRGYSESDFLKAISSKFKSTLFLKKLEKSISDCMEQENNTWTICYDFLIDSVPGVLTIDIDGLEETSPKYKSVYEIQVDENGGWFLYHIDIRRKAL